MVSVGDQDRLELPSTPAEVLEALRYMPTNKSLGMDGLTVEFYRVFRNVLRPDLVTIWAESLQSAVLPLSCRRAMLVLLPKKVDLHDLRNWCPISLLSTDYKVCSESHLAAAREVNRVGAVGAVVMAAPVGVCLVVQDPGDLAWEEACQAIYSAASSARVN
ncbi:unnamed protein product [Caretta caretta]